MNKLAFSTLGCPEWDMTQMLDAAQRYGYAALELRGYQSEMDLSKADPFTPANRGATLTRITDAGVSVCCVASSGTVSQANYDDVQSHVELAHDLNAPFVRIFGGKLPDDLPREKGLELFAQTLRRFGDLAQTANVGLVLETHDSFSTGASVAELIALAAHPAVFSLWDLHHPYRQGEPPTQTHHALAPTLRHLHVKDGKDGTYTLLGDGDVPVFPMLDIALDSGYTGAICLEWEKRWHPTLPPPEIAFPQYADGLRAYLESRAA